VIFEYQSTVNQFNWESVNNGIEDFFSQNSVSVANLFSIQLIIEEIVTNIIKYGKSTGNEIIKIHITIYGGQINLVISDNTAPFNPLEIKNPDTELSAEERNVGGLGLFLVKQKSNSLSYEYVKSFNIVKIGYLIL
jgi:anti-sigma regulatory factor (Ser/Thr protein kinase)